MADYRNFFATEAKEHEKIHARWKATADKETSSTEKKYSVFFGRWQPWHAGHRWLIDQRLNEGKNVWIAIRDVKPDDINPWTAEEVLDNVKNELCDLFSTGQVIATIVPDIESINYGRGVGYDIIEHVPPQDIHDVSATKIREQMKKDGKL
jgi:nicotinamide mononucleotide adenylyltransferase